MRRFLAILGALAIAGALSIPAYAAKAPDAVCWFDATTLYASGLPMNDTFGYTFALYPTGTTLRTDDGTFSVDVTEPTPLTAYFWERGGGRSLMKLGPQLNDYHVIATCRR